MALPAIVLALAYIGEYTIVMRSSMLDTVREDYLQLARAKGLRDADVRRRHAVPNALLPVVSLSALNFGFVLSGAIAVESIFSWPGLGQATFEAIRGPDFPVLQGLFLLFSAALIVANLAVDLFIRLPRSAGGGPMNDVPVSPLVDESTRSRASPSRSRMSRPAASCGRAAGGRSPTSAAGSVATGWRWPGSSCCCCSWRWRCSPR